MDNGQEVRRESQFSNAVKGMGVKIMTTRPAVDPAPIACIETNPGVEVKMGKKRKRTGAPAHLRRKSSRLLDELIVIRR